MNGQIIALLNAHSGAQVDRQAIAKWDDMAIVLGTLLFAVIIFS